MHAMLLSGDWVLVAIPRVKSESPHVEMTNGDDLFVALRRKCKDCLDRNPNNVSEWIDISTRGLLFQYANTNYSCLSSTYRV